MPYAASVTVTPYGVPNGRRAYTVTVAETGITGSTDEWTVTLTDHDLPRVGRIVAVDVVKDSGAFTACQPRAGSATGLSDIYDAGSSAAAPRRFHPSAGIVWPNSGTIVGCTAANSTGAATTTFLIVEGID